MSIADVSVACRHFWQLPPSDHRGRCVAICRVCGARRIENTRPPPGVGLRRGPHDPLAAGVAVRALREIGL